MADGMKPVALVTGASSGIGRAYAGRLAAAGYDLVLVSRDQQRLESLAYALTDVHGVFVEVWPADLSRESSLIELESRILRLENLRFLVNAAGFLTKGHFADVAVESQSAMVRVHCEAVVRLTRAALPGIVASGGRRAIVNVASVAAFGTSAGNITYCATKAFLKSFSEGLAIELADNGVRVQALCPGYTKTEIHERASMPTQGIPESWWLTAEKVVEDSYRALSRGQVVCVPGLRYRILTTLAPLFPASLQIQLKRFFQDILGRHER
jgi:uncharacterized protein